MNAGENTGAAFAAKLQATHVPRKHPVYWFDDGSLLLEVEDVQFRVHKALLQRHSSFLAAAEPNGFSPLILPRGNDAHASVIYGVERGFTCRDVEAFLEHMYHDHPLSATSPFERIAAVLRASSSQQFDIPALHAHAQMCLQSYFKTCDLSALPSAVVSEAISLARTFRNLPVLKFALYQTMVTSSLDSDDEVTSPDVTLLDPQGQTPSKPERTSDPRPSLQGYQLTEADVKLCKRLMTRVIDRFTPILFTPATTPHMACTDVFADTWMNLVISPAITSNGVYKPIETLEMIKGLDWAKHGLCATCVVEKHEEWSEEQQAIWNMIEKWLVEEVEI
ncbi:hypothetical protein AN958_12392 [Leucoagaricus sp. SymC.cos]|nr:hypothetical protein AN958_12392 [Leucoagaricus sp. SymC.cos]